MTEERGPQDAPRGGAVADPSGGVVVANPGHLPWLSRAALELSRHGLLRAYMAPFAATNARAKRGLPRFVRAELQRREAPSTLGCKAVSVGSRAEMLAVAADRIGLPPHVRRLMADHRDRAFSRGVSRHLSNSDAAILLAYGAATEAIRAARAKSIGTALEYAVHHHEFNRALLVEELRRQPDYAASMQFHDASQSRDKRLDRELADVDRVVVFSEFSRRTFLAAGVPGDKLVVNQLGVDPGRYRDVTRTADNTFRVLFLGVLSQRKGISYLIDGFQRVAIPNSELLLVGTPWRGHSPWAGIHGIRHLPWIDQRETPTLFGTADVLVLPSLVEGLARVLLEAMAAGVPVIATPNTGAEDIVRDGVDGYIVPIRDDDAIADRLLRLHADPALRHEMASAARERARGFSWEHYGDRCAAIVRELATEGPSA